MLASGAKNFTSIIFIAETQNNMVEIGGIVILGILAQWIAWKLKVPAILPLIITGLLVGPLSTLWTDGEKLINPIWDGSHGLFPGEHLFHFVELSIGIILFEGGMTLKRNEIRGIGDTIGKLISIGALVTFAASTLLAHYVVELNWSVSFLFAALIIVTGPTVIAPILRNVPLNKNVATVLKWEGILIDPIGALAAVLVYEFISAAGHHEGSFTVEALTQFIQICLVGLSLGTISALALREMLKRDWIPHYLLTIFSLAFVLFLFIASSLIVHDSGLLTVVVAGMVLGNIEVKHINEIYYFKESLAILLISVLFILLSANIDISDLQLLQDWRPLTLFALVIFLVRPLSVFISTMQSTLTTKEKLFISWMGPRGIVAAGIASLFGLKLAGAGFPQAEYITPLVFMVVLGTVLLNATTANLVAKMLGVTLETSNGILIVGSTKPSRLIAEYLQGCGLNVVLVDSNKNNTNRAEAMGLKAVNANIYTDNLSDNLDLNDVGVLMAMTGSHEVNQHAVENLSKSFGEHGAYRLISAEELKQPDSISEEGLFSPHDDYINYREVARDYAEIHEYVLHEGDSFGQVIEKINVSRRSIPLFIRKGADNISPILASQTEANIAEGDILVYMGKAVLTAEEAA